MMITLKKIRWFVLVLWPLVLVDLFVKLFLSEKDKVFFYKSLESSCSEELIKLERPTTAVDTPLPKDGNSA
jgi:hypothetical protein